MKDNIVPFLTKWSVHCQEFGSDQGTTAKLPFFFLVLALLGFLVCLWLCNNPGSLLMWERIH